MSRNTSRTPLPVREALPACCDVTFREIVRHSYLWLGCCQQLIGLRAACVHWRRLRRGQGTGGLGSLARTGLDWRTESSFRTRTVDLNLNLRVYRRRLGSRLAMRGEGWAPSRTGQQVPERALPADRAASAGYRSTSPTSLSSSTRRRSKPSSRCASRCRGRGSTACKE